MEKYRIKNNFLILFVLIVSLVIGCNSNTNSTSRLPESHVSHNLDLSDMMQLYKVRDFFSLRERLNTISNPESPVAQFLLAIVQNAFNEPTQSSRTINAILEDSAQLPDSLVHYLWSTKLSNHLLLSQY